MPQVAAAIVAAIGLTGIAATIATAVLTLAITVGLNYIANSLFGPKAPKPSDGQQTVRVNVGSRVRHYGTVRIAGQLTFYESRNGTLYILVTTGHGRLNGILEYLINGKLVTVDGSGLVTDSKFQGAVSIHHRLGTDDQAAYSQLTSVFSEVTANHRQRGCSSILTVARGVSSKKFAQVYEGNRQPEALVTVEASLVYDPRKDSTAIIGYDGEGDPIMGSGAHRVNDPDTWEHSDNWALCFADYLAHPDGYGQGYDAINWTNIAGEAEICDDTITTVDDRVIPLWRMSGSYRLADDERRTIVKEFLKAGDGFMWQDAEGLTNIRCGRWIAPTVHIPAKHITDVTASLGANATQRANEVRVIYMEPRFGYTETEAAPQINQEAYLDLGRSEVSRFDAYYIPDHNQAQRVGKRILARVSDDRWQVTISTNLYGLNAIGERFILVTIPELDIDGLSFEITSFRIDLGSLRVEIGLLEAREEDFSFNSATEEGQPPQQGGDTTVVISVEDMENLALSAVQVSLGGASGVGIQATWDAPARPDLIPQAQYRPTGGTDWLEMIVTDDSNVATTGVVSTGIEYQVRGRFVTISGRPSDWSDLETITPNAAIAAPSTPTGFTATGGVGNADLEWRNPPEANFHHVEIMRNSVNDFSTAVQTGGDQFGGLAADMAVTISLSAGTHYLWLVSYSASGQFSLPAGPQTVTVT